MSQSFMLTTFDNPFDPFVDFDKWFLFDVDHDYNSCAYLARIAKIADSMSETEVEEEKERAINEILKNDFLNIYKKVSKNSTETLLTPA